MSTENGTVPQELLTLARAAAAPQLTGVELDRRFGPRSTWVPAVGQMWRAVREDISALVLLLAVDTETVTVVPLTVEPSDTADTVTLDGTVLGAPVTAWVGLTRTMPMSVLDRPIGHLGSEVLSRLAGQGTATSLSPEFLTDDVRAELDDDLTLLAAPPCTTASSPVLADGPGITLDLDAIDQSGLEEAKVRLVVPLPVVLDLVDGKRPPTPAQAEVLREVFGAAPETLPPPASLVRELSQPRWRGLIRQHQHRGGSTEDEARSSLAYDVFAMAARQTGDASPSWPDRILRWAQAHQVDPDADA